MNSRIGALAILTACASTLYAGAAQESDRGAAARVRPPWERGETRKPETNAPPKPSLATPEPLRRRPAPERSRNVDALERDVAADAGRDAARAVATVGASSYFRVGFHQGLRVALDSAALGAADYRQGRRRGERDDDARRAGREEGTFAAVEVAGSEAENLVAAQFRDLSAEPAFAPRTPPVSWTADLPFLEVPDLASLLEEFPLDRGGLVPRIEFERYLDDWGWTALRLSRCPDYTEFYDASWADGARAFERWSRSHAKILRGLPEIARRRLANLYRVEYEGEIDRLSVRLDEAWVRGGDLGWNYGAFLREELEYRRGYVAGFRDAARESAERAFDRRFADAYRDAYAAAFERWSSAVVPAIGAVRLVDADDDDVIEPGEGVMLDVELINFGGASADVEVTLEGRTLETTTATVAALPRRSSVLRRDLLRARIDPAVAARSRSQLIVRLGDESRAVDLFVARPLELVAGSLRLTRDNLRGDLTVEIEARNISLVDRPATLTLRTTGASGMELERELGTVPAKGRASARFELSGLAPLDLVAGRVGLDLRLDRGTVPQDRLTRDVPGTAEDLGSRDLPLLIERLLVEGATDNQAALVRTLVLERLRADWVESVRASGNPYKRDLRSGRGDTALGELVVLSKRSARHDDPLLAGLSGDVMRLSEDLPGPHPLLRKWARKLARRLP